MSLRGDVSDMTAEELDRLPNYLSGLPTNPVARAEALEAWKEGGPRGLNDWRQARIQNLHKPIKNRISPASDIIH